MQRVEDPVSLLQLLKNGAPEAPAIAAPGRPATTYAELRALAEQVRGELRTAGLGRNDTVAIVLPNGPEMATAFVTMGAAVTTAPLNPAYKAEEFDFYLTDLNASVLVLPRGVDSPARAIAEHRGIPILALDAGEGPAGTFRLAPESKVTRSPSTDGPLEADDVALVLHTSGTTARPKLVPLTSANLCASARHIHETLSLVAGDVCLNVMPLFHIHGLIAAVLATLSAGASVSCTPGFDALKFFGWLESVGPTWYTAVPTMHQAILARAARNVAIAKNARLRFIRSSSASLPPQVMKELEDTFGAPVIEAYGMSEAAHQMASNPLPPRARKAGSVGLAAGPEIAIMDDAGALLPAGEEGEVVIRGPNVTRGYVGAPEANAKAFTNGWFRTGDRGKLDAEGYLHLTGRIKELINRGGEKVSPLEVDAVLMDHPAVAQVVTFGVPHDKLGEEVAAAIVLREGMTVTERELKDLAAKRLAAFKVPRTIVFVETIPKGPTGKMQRIGLAQRLGLTS
ncbi:O-succinylbenzoic acid--CoA ligase [Labilithrix luteola]|uniref:O-succinylbenzoic acid--CoA ligase n=1 Tax=Labilithrix luteola TaxID=1391654 RepID=A0A0K1Q0T8_9BACT|nr:acyl--CoA ligase [Labilithrix luteola]AKU99400.1 O-succinylbenzoic acid--CoA ligase [Labilithrix luteola]